MTSHAMPFLMVNLGVEIIFVLHSRLQAQSVALAQAEGVLCDIAGNIFSPAFLDELFAPQPMYSGPAVLQVLSALSRSSVMHLSDNSLKKLCDLVLMTVKYQVLTLQHPIQLYELTLNHLDQAALLLPVTVRHLASDAAGRFDQLTRSLLPGHWAMMRQAVLNFFGGRHVRVSVFLERQMQERETGAFRLPPYATIFPLSSCQPPGRVEVVGAAALGAFPHPASTLRYPPSVSPANYDPTNPAVRQTRNGMNLYASSQSVADPLGRQTREMPTRRAGVESAGATTSYTAPAPTALTEAELQKAYEAEANDLLRLVGHGGGGALTKQHTFELDLFADETTAGASEAVVVYSPAAASSSVVAARSTPSPAANGVAVNAPVQSVEVPVSRMSTAAVQQQNSRLLGIMNDFEKTKTVQVGKASDLLDIMDEL